MEVHKRMDCPFGDDFSKAEKLDVHEGPKPVVAWPTMIQKWPLHKAFTTKEALTHRPLGILVTKRFCGFYLLLRFLNMDYMDCLLVTSNPCCRLIPFVHLAHAGPCRNQPTLTMSCLGHPTKSSNVKGTQPFGAKLFPKILNPRALRVYVTLTDGFCRNQKTSWWTSQRRSGKGWLSSQLS